MTAASLAPSTRPAVIQGGMGVAVSSWRLARAVSIAGGLGVVSGTALDVVLARRLQDGDTDGSVRRAMAHFPHPQVSEQVLARYFRPQGRPPGRPYRNVAKLSLTMAVRDQHLSVLANFVEVWLARQGHDGPVGINYLEKVQLATPAAAYGAMLAGVDYVLMGAGIPTEIPRLLDALARHEPGVLPVHVDSASDLHTVTFDPATLPVTPGQTPATALRRPQFLAIVSAHVLAAYLARDAATRPDGFVIEGPSAGGHNAPPRGRVQLDEAGQPVYGRRDEADLAQIAALGLPFWLAGSYGTPERLRAARAAGAVGVQVGTLFALSAESGFTPALRAELLGGLDDVAVRTDPLASPTGFPFKVVALPLTAADPATYAARPRLCDLGYLRTAFQHPDGTIGYRCPGEPVADYVRKGGAAADTEGRTCLCNSLTANVGLGQTRHDGYREVPLATLGSDLDGSRRLLAAHPDGWTAADAVRWLSDVESEAASG